MAEPTSATSAEEYLTLGVRLKSATIREDR